MQISDFKLALNGQIYDSEGLLYSYPEKITQLRATGQYPAWINALQSDSRFLRELVNPGGECFSVRYSQEGLYYSFTKYNPHDSRNGVVSIALYTQNKAVNEAKQLMNMLRNLMDYFLEKNSVIGISDADVENLLKDITNLYSIQLPTGEAASPLDAYRVYQTEEELQKWLYCAIQKEYTHYKWVHFISATNRKAVINPTLYSELNGRVMECYAIKRGEGYELALGGTNCSLSFTREGYMPQKVTFTVGQPSQYVTIDANHVIHPKSVNELGLTFKKKVTILLFDESSKMPIVKDGRQMSYTEELMENTPKNVYLNAEGYYTKKIKLDPAKVSKAEGNISEYLQRDLQTYGPDKGIGWEDEREDEGVSRKKLIIFLAIAVIGGAVLGFFVHKLAFAPAPKAQETVTASSENNMEKNYVAQIDSLKEEIDKQKDANELLRNQISDKDGEINRLNKKLTNRENTELENKAKKYLKDNQEWAIGSTGMKGCCGNVKKYEDTEAYEFLSYLLEADKLDANRLNFILSFKVEGNAKWDDIVSAMKAKKSAGASVSKFVDALKNTNTAYDSSKKGLKPGKKSFMDGTIKLNDLLRNIKAIPNE